MSQARRHQPRLAGRLALAVSCLAAGTASFFLVLDPTLLLWLWAQFAVQMFVVGAVTCLAFYLYSLPEGAPINYSTAARRAVAGGVFGYVAAKSGAGFGLNDNLQTASAGIGGAKGPNYMDRAIDALTRRA